MFRYHVLKALGAGAAGGVYLVEDQLAGGALRALKRIQAGSDPEFRSSLAREFAMLASLAVDGVARVFDLGVLPAEGELPGGPYFTREFITGEPLDAYAAVQPVAERLRVVVALAGIVRALHRRGVVHGDLKPANVIVDPLGKPWLIDFGLSARARDLEQLRGSGTLPFMSPELRSGAAPSAASDIFALAATLWAVLTGAPPAFARPRGGRGQELGPRVPADLPELARTALAVALDGLALHPAQRTCSVDELCARLEALIEVPASAPSDALGTSGAPRTRGRDELLASLESACASRGDEAALAEVLCGAEGAGKSVVLRELKWRLQLAGRRVVYVDGHGLGGEPAWQVREQVLAADAPAPGDARSGRPLEALLAADGTAPRWVLLVDDLDVVEPSWASALRELLHEDPRRVPHVLATATDSAAPQLRALAGHTLLAPLPAAAATALAHDLFGVMEPAALERLVAHAAGNPGALVAAFHALRGRGAITAADIAALSPALLARSVWEPRVAAASERAQLLLGGLALAEGPLSERFAASFLGAEAASAVAELVGEGLVRAERGRLWAVDRALIATVQARDGARVRQERAAAMMAVPDADTLALPVRARLAIAACHAARIAALAPRAADELCQAGSHREASQLLAQGAAELTGSARRALQLQLGELCANLGEGERARALAAELLADPTRTPDDDARIRIFGARAQIAAGAVEDAEQALARTHDDAAPPLRARALCELARIQLRRGAFDSAAENARTGLALAPAEDASRAELAAIRATVLARSGEVDAARRDFEDALAFAGEHAGSRERALVAGYFALELEREGDMARAKATYERALEHAREAEDVGQMATYAMNLGNVSFRLGEIEQSERGFVLAAKLARRAGRSAMALVADVNLAHVLVYLGAYARARSVVLACRAATGGQPAPLLIAQTTHVLAELAARGDDAEEALANYAHAQAEYAALGRAREACEVLLDAAECLLDRAGVSDASAASTKLAQARGSIEQHALHDLRLGYELLVARTRMQNGDVDGAVRELAALEARVERASDPELRWKVAFALAGGYRQSGATLVAASKARAAAELVEALALRLSPDLREGFRRDPRRRAALSLHKHLEREVASAESSSSRGDTRIVHGVDARYRRLLEVNKRLARERDVDRVLERITDTAIELSGAERGFVLLVDASGGLGTHVVRVHGGQEGDPHVAFSRSIAEAVLIDGEPIVTVNARDDRRLNEYLSVHKLMLKSVACIPVNGKDRTLGVLYLEHRMRAGRFDEQDLDLLIAFADQAAIALENARLWAEVETQKQALATANDELTSAKAELTRLLHARTEELQAARVSLEKAQESALLRGTRFGIVGRSAAMQRVFATLERVQHSSVPVVVQGESGTGKELVARAIHAGSARARGPFVTLNCAAVPETLIESELFGHVKGAFTGADRERKGVFAQAQGGTLFLDEFAEASPRLQVALLRVLQEGKVLPVGADQELAVDVRVVVACQRPLRELVAQGRLREDLYYRLSVVELRVPALRERGDDIPELCEHLLRQIAKREQREPLRLTRSALDALMRHALPGNVRQLEHLLLSAAMMADGSVIGVESLALEPVAAAPAEAAPADDDAASPRPDSVLPEDLASYKAREKSRILDALDRHAWNRAKAAHELGMPRRTFYRRLSEFGILDS